MIRHEPDPQMLTLWDYLDDFTDFLAIYAGWGVVVLIVGCLVVMFLRPRVLRIANTVVQRVTTEFFLAMTLLVGRSIVVRATYRADLPQPLRAVFWLIVFTLCWRFFYFALWAVWVRPLARGMWRMVIRPRVFRCVMWMRRRSF